MIEERPYQRNCQNKECLSFGTPLVDRGYNNLVCRETKPKSKIRGFGTKEWSTESGNVSIGCKHGCLYCYAMMGAVRRKQVSGYYSWINPKDRKGTVRTHKTDGVVMIPTTHDITMDNYTQFMELVSSHLRKGNDVLIVSKPHSAIIEKVAREFCNFTDQLKFRFTITAKDENLLKYWEPFAPSLTDRLNAINRAHDFGFTVSISIEPLLENPVPLVDTLKRILRQDEEIWIGRMNHMNEVEAFWKDQAGWDIHQWNFLCMASDPTYIRMYYNDLKDDPQIRWKESILKIVEMNE